MKIKHGLWNHPLYSTWNHMRFRCSNKKSVFYKDYGGRGIRVCKRWESLANFIEDMGEKPPGTSLDRIDNNGHYSPENCRWADNTTQQNNKRNVRKFAHAGETKTLKEWCDFYGKNLKTVNSRLYRGWEFETALTFPASKSNGGFFCSRVRS